MSSYSKLIIFILVLLFISAAIFFIDSSMDSINRTMPGVSDSIVNGDKEYNEAVQLVNDKSFDEAKTKAVSAENNYNNSLIKLNGIRNNFSSDINEVQEEYIGTVIKELELKINAVNNLKEAIDCFKINSNYTGTNYASKANDLMYEATEYQHERNSIVKNNSNLFKQQNFVI
ncbi:hypothetical protein SAMN05216439_0994 [Methanobrevibacter gottschalkii]|uniref:Uncharacterized protein n=3 Tax=Methanobacteriaceae TaxID=2159 RepID=A0A3N5BYA8_9EURY|nr:hypothetical protein EDC42_1482 [Methanobrevibacter gottschalkii DSM 11977]SEK46589.1 hypothetical protein SAMN05216439_0994 [Methanobrevibacter gottschalkii]